MSEMNTTETITQVVPDTTDEMSARDDRDLEQVRLLTQMMREHEKAIVDLGKKRRRLMKSLRDRRVTYPRIAEATGTTTQSVYKDLRWGK